MCNIITKFDTVQHTIIVTFYYTILTVQHYKNIKLASHSCN